MLPPKEWPGVLAVIFGGIVLMNCTFVLTANSSGEAMVQTVLCGLSIGLTVHHARRYQEEQMQRIVDGKRRTWW